MKILLLGGDGQVGHQLRRSLAPLGELAVSTLTGTLSDGSACERLDLTDFDAIAALVDRVAPDVVVNATAHTAVDRAEDESDLAFRVNAGAPERLAAACATHDAILVHYSTDYVFGGDGVRPYREDDAPAPLGVYGASKLAGERAILDSECRHLIFRTAWVYGLHGHNFLRTMLRLGAERDELRVVSDQVGTPTPAALIADVTARALQHLPSASGLWHLTAAGETSWHGFAEAIFARAVEQGLLPRAPRVVPIATSEYPTRASRPSYSCLDTGKLGRDFGVELPDWKAALAGVLDGGHTGR